MDAIKESERQFRLLVAGVTDYAVFMLDPNGIITTWNAGAQRIKGYTEEEIVGHHFSKFYTVADRAAGVPARALYTASQEGRFEIEGWRVRKDGTMFWANVVIDPIWDEQRRLIGFAKITRDITERREMQLALQEAQNQRAQAQKMDALGQLTGGVAHDFNNLLMVIRGHIRALQKAVADDAKLARSAEAISLAAQRGEALTRQLLTFARRQIVNPTVLDVGGNIYPIEIERAGGRPGGGRSGRRTLSERRLGRSARRIRRVPDGGCDVRIPLTGLSTAPVLVQVPSLSLEASNA